MSTAMTASYAAALLLVPLMSGLAGMAYMTGLKRNWGPEGIRECWKKAFHIGAVAAAVAYAATFPTTLEAIPDAWRYEAWIVPQGFLGTLLTPVAAVYWDLWRMTPKLTRIFTKRTPEDADP